MKSHLDLKIYNCQGDLAQMASPSLVRTSWKVRSWVQNPLCAYITYQLKRKKDLRINNHSSYFFL